MKKIGIIVVTYNRLDCLKKNVEALSKVLIPNGYETTTYIVNNASNDGTKEWLEEIENKNIKIINLESNTGGSGGFYNGMKYAVEQNMDYIWGMDDDAYPEPESLHKIINVMNIEKKDAGYWSNCNNDLAFDGLYKKVEHWMFVGFFISTNIIRQIGYPRKDFFIYFDDVEYGRRIIKNGYNIYKIKKSIIKHKDAVSNNYEGRIFYKKIHIPKLSDWKMYYFVRNGLLMYNKNEKEYWKRAYIDMPKFILKVIVIKPDQLKTVLKGFWHGIIRKTGKIISP